MNVSFSADLDNFFRSFSEKTLQATRTTFRIAEAEEFDRFVVAVVVVDVLGILLVHLGQIKASIFCHLYSLLPLFWSSFSFDLGGRPPLSFPSMFPVSFIGFSFVLFPSFCTPPSPPTPLFWSSFFWFLVACNLYFSQKRYERERRVEGVVPRNGRQPEEGGSREGQETQGGHGQEGEGGGRKKEGVGSKNEIEAIKGQFLIFRNKFKNCEYP